MPGSLSVVVNTLRASRFTSRCLIVAAIFGTTTATAGPITPTSLEYSSAPVLQIQQRIGCVCLTEDPQGNCTEGICNQMLRMAPAKQVKGKDNCERGTNLVCVSSSSKKSACTPMCAGKR